MNASHLLSGENADSQKRKREGPGMIFRLQLRQYCLCNHERTVATPIQWVAASGAATAVSLLECHAHMMGTSIVVMIVQQGGGCR